MFTDAEILSLRKLHKEQVEDYSRADVPEPCDMCDFALYLDNNGFYRTISSFSLSKLLRMFSSNQKKYASQVVRPYWVGALHFDSVGSSFKNFGMPREGEALKEKLSDFVRENLISGLVEWVLEYRWNYPCKDPHAVITAADLKSFMNTRFRNRFISEYKDSTYFLKLVDKLARYETSDQVAKEIPVDRVVRNESIKASGVIITRSELDEVVDIVSDPKRKPNRVELQELVLDSKHIAKRFYVPRDVIVRPIDASKNIDRKQNSKKDDKIEKEVSDEVQG